MANESVVLRFSEVTFAYDHKQILDEASFSLRNNSKIALMGQNGAGKSSMFKLITGELKPDAGQVFLSPKETTVAVAKQVMPPEHLDLDVREYFQSAFPEKLYDLDHRIKEVFNAVNVDLPLEKKVRSFSGGQQARLLLAYALIQNPDILLLDEPTNNLDQDGIEHLTAFLIMYEKTCVVISHDSDFLNSFTDGVLYLDIFNHKVEQYSGTYLDVVQEISNRVEKEELQNVRAEKEIKKLKAQAEVFAHKGGKLRLVAKKMRIAAEEAEESKVDVRREDKTIRGFEIPAQEFSPLFDGKILTLTSVTVIKKHKPTQMAVDIVLRKNNHLLIAGPNGIGKTTLLESIASGKAKGSVLGEGVVIGYYRQDFSTLNFEQRAYDSLMEVMQEKDDQTLRGAAAKFLLDGKLLDQTIKNLSEGQKGLLAIARLVLQKPGLLILDEPTNHINFRHLPIIAEALNEYKGAMILVSHIPDFVQQIRIDNILELK